jgi:hypothetical protein
LKARSSQAPVAAASDSIEAKLQRLAGGEGRGGSDGRLDAVELRKQAWVLKSQRRFGRFGD